MGYCLTAHPLFSHPHYYFIPSPNPLFHTCYKECNSFLFNFLGYYSGHELKRREFIAELFYCPVIVRDMTVNELLLGRVVLLSLIYIRATAK